MVDIGWRRRRGSIARRGARQRAGLTPASASNTLSCQRETLHSQQLKSIKKSIDSNHGIYRDPPTRPLWRDAPAPRTPQWDIFDWHGQEERACDVGSTVDTSMAVPEPGVFRASGSGAPAWR